ncbi:hypothetical protein RFI_38573, partial [Reticulomyxa filosa]
TQLHMELTTLEMEMDHSLSLLLINLNNNKHEMQHFGDLSVNSTHGNCTNLKMICNEKEFYCDRKHLLGRSRCKERKIVEYLNYGHIFRIKAGIPVLIMGETVNLFFKKMLIKKNKKQTTIITIKMNKTMH